MTAQWLTNDPDAAKALRKADKKFADSHAAAKNLPFLEKLAAFRHAKAVHEADYDLINCGAYDRV